MRVEENKKRMRVKEVNPCLKSECDKKRREGRGLGDKRISQ